MTNCQCQIVRNPSLEFVIGNLESTIGPPSKLSVDDSVDDTIVREIEKDGFIDRLYP